MHLRTLKTTPLLLSPLHRVASANPVPPNAQAVDLERRKPDSRALDRFGIETALRLGLLPLRPAGAITPVAAARRADFDAALPDLERALGPVAYCRAERHEIEAHIADMRARDAHSRKMGVSSVPTFIVAQQHAVPGAQPPEMWLKVIKDIMAQMTEAE